MSGRLSWSAQRRWGAAVLVSALVGLGVLVASASGEGLIYYRTPTEIAASADGGVVRVAGIVVPGSMTMDDELSEFVITDGATELTVSYDGRLPALVQEGEGVVVEGTRTSTGAMAADGVLLRHSNEYGPPEADVR